MLDIIPETVTDPFRRSACTVCSQPIGGSYKFNFPSDFIGIVKMQIGNTRGAENGSGIEKDTREIEGKGRVQRAENGGRRGERAAWLDTAKG